MTAIFAFAPNSMRMNLSAAASEQKVPPQRALASSIRQVPDAVAHTRKRAAAAAKALASLRCLTVYAEASALTSDLLTCLHDDHSLALEDIPSNLNRN
jgi:hypothetical protein